MKGILVCVLVLVACSQAAHIAKRQTSDPTEDRTCSCPGGTILTWTQWEPCSAACRTTTNPNQKRHLECDLGGGVGVFNCKSQSATCHLMPCDDGKDWGPFDQCSEPCGGGVRQRVSGTNPNDVQTINCHTQSCDPVEDCGIADIIFVLDSSNSLSIVNWFRTKQFVIDVVKGLPIGSENVRVAVISFSTEVHLNFGLDFSYDADVLEAEITNLPFMAGVTNTADALRLMKNTFAASGRRDARHIGVVLTDGVSNVFETTTIPNAEAARDQDVLIFSIGVGHNIKLSELEGIASQPATDYTFTVNDFDSLALITEAAIKGTCEAAETMTCTKWEADGTCSVSCGGSGVQIYKRTCTVTDNSGSRTHEVTKTEECGEGPCDPCASCETRDGIGFIPDPEDCRKYFVCEKQEDGSYKRYPMCCGDNTYWNQGLLTCIESAQTSQCSLVVPSPCDVNTPITTPAPNPNCPFEAVTGDNTRFAWKGLDHLAPIACPPGTVFNTAACACVNGNNPGSCKSDPMLHFPYNDHFNDISCNKAVSDKKGSPTLWPGRNTTAAHFDGNSKLDVHFMNNWFANKDVKHFSVALWFNRESGSDLAGLVNNGDCTEPSFEVEVESNIEVTGFMDTFGAAATTKKQLQGYKVELNRWYHVALVYDGDNLDLYIDGDKKTNGEQLKGFIENRQCPMQVAHHGMEDGNGYFHGYIDDLRVYDRTISANEVRDLYQAGAL